MSSCGVKERETHHFLKRIGSWPGDASEGMAVRRRLLARCQNSTPYASLNHARLTRHTLEKINTTSEHTQQVKNKSTNQATKQEKEEKREEKREERRERGRESGLLTEAVGFLGFGGSSGRVYGAAMA